ncbi:MAG: type I-C CRISPR-associated protein Cas8c/Csd1 [Candidatus Riflebacteria bacterium]|nr:type I-C CRISPR-associated protein Cas8c/Csd1 [Candidatus Riflebacteria bacterium]
MFIQALAAYADTYLADQLEDPAFESKPVPYWVVISPDGRFQEIREQNEEKIVGKKKVVVPRSLLVPKSPVNRNSGVHPLLGCDAIQYLFGPCLPSWTKPGEEAKHRGHHSGFVALMEKMAGETADPGLKTCVRFLKDESQLELARKELADKKAKGGALVAMAPALPSAGEPPQAVPVIQREAVRQAWRDHFHRHFADRHEKGGAGVCLISGKTGPLAVTHEPVKGTSNIGGQASGVRLMSFDKGAFESYGWERNLNSPVSPDRATAYVLALNDLLTPGQHRRGRTATTLLRTRSDYAGMAFLYWTRDPDDLDPFQAITDKAAALFEALWKGNASALAAIPANEFYLVAVSGNGGRLVVRDWLTESLAGILARIRSWFDDLRMIPVISDGEDLPPPTLFELLRVLTPGRVKPQDIGKEPTHSVRVLAFVRRAFRGAPLGRSILAAALGRLRVETGTRRLDSHRLGLIRLCVNDLTDGLMKGGLRMPISLDSRLRHPAYLCGRLLAIYDGLQFQAQGDLNVTVTDRFYGMAMTNPRLAFPKLEILSRAHLKKLRKNKPAAHHAIESRLHEIISLLTEGDPVFPANLSLEDQGRFAIGFHHQKAEDLQRIREAKSSTSAPPARNHSDEPSSLTGK